jgi:predicted deacylase
LLDRGRGPADAHPPEQIKGTLLVLPILNVQGFRRRSIYVMPEDGKNLNRMFPGNPAGTTSERLAHWLVTNVYPLADAYADLHGGDLDEALAPFTIFPRGCEKSKALAGAFGLPTAVAAGSGGYTIDAACRAGVPSILPEVSGNGLWGEDTVAQMTAGVERVIIWHLLTQGEDYAWVRPALRAKKLRDFELRSGESARG